MKRILILSGPTHEYLDPVRFIGNASSGLMGKALAEEAVKRGYAVEVISGPVAPSSLPEVGKHGTIHQVVCAREMLETASNLFPSADAVIFAAAVADYAPRDRLSEKAPKTNDELTLHLQPTPDIAKTLCAHKRPGQIAIGFALQSSDGENHARRKLQGKKLDGIVLNTPASLGAVGGTFSYLAVDAKRFEPWGDLKKDACAGKILDEIDRLASETGIT